MTRRSRRGSRAHVEYIVAHQRSDGWFGPYPLDAVTQALRPVGDPAGQQGAGAVSRGHRGRSRRCRRHCRSMRAMLAGLDATPLYDWGRFRWYEGLVPALYAYERTGEPWLLDLARKLRAQGVDFEALMADRRCARCRRRVADCGNGPSTSSTWRWRPRRRPSAGGSTSGRRTAPSRRRWSTCWTSITARSTGMFSGDECLAGRNPLQGSELCAVVEYMYSLEHLHVGLRRRRLRRSPGAARLQRAAGRRSRPTCGRTSTTSR